MDNREHVIDTINSGLPNDNSAILRCLDIIENESDDLVRAYARVWLQNNSVALAKRIISKS